MASDRSVTTEVKGLKELKAAFKKMESDIGPELKKGFTAIAEDVASTARGLVPKRTGRAAASIKARGSTTGGKIAFGGSAAPYYPWLDFGGTVGKGHKSQEVQVFGGGTLQRRTLVQGRGGIYRKWLGNPVGEGRYIYPTIRNKRDDIIERTDDLIENLAERAGFETTGGN